MLSTRLNTAPVARPQSKPFVRRADVVRRQLAPPCHGVQFTKELEALLMSAMERSSCMIADRVGIIGLKLQQGSGQTQETGEFAWEAGVQLACYVRDYMHSDLHNTTVLELGSGIGLVGLTCACFGARAVLTDLPQVLDTTEANVQANAHIFQSAGGSADLAVLDWASPHPDLVSGPWDLVLGSDLVYEPHHAELLGPLLADLLAANPDTKVLLAHAHRSESLDDHMTEVFMRCGLRIREATRTGADVPEQDISVIVISRA